MEFIIYMILSIIISLIFFITVKKCTRVLGYICLITFSIILNLVFLSKSLINIILNFLISCFLIFIYYSISSRFTYDFSDKILSVTYIVSSLFKPDPKKDCRVIGRVIPYNNYQLKYNGKYLTASEIATAGGTLMTGSMGSGKTYFLSSLMKQNIDSSYPVILCDYKGDLKVSNEIIDYAKKHNYLIFNLSGEKSDFNYDPLKNINNVGRIEAIINMRKWSLDGADEHYRTSTQLLLQKLVYEFSHKYKGDNFTYNFYNYVKSYRYLSEERDAYNTVSKLLELLITSTLKSMFEGNNDKTLDFKEIKNKKFLLVVSFVSSNKELATSFSSLLFKDLLDEFTNNQPNKNIFLYLDETATLTNPFIVKDITEKGRSAKIAITLATQDINQIIIQTNEAYLDTLLGTMNNFIIFNGATRTVAEKLAGVQLYDIENVIMSLKKPVDGKSPTALYISKYPTLNKKSNSEVFRFEPYIFNKRIISEFNLNNIKSNKDVDVNIVNNIDNNNPKETVELNNLNQNIVNKEEIIDDVKEIDYNDFI